MEVTRYQKIKKHIYDHRDTHKEQYNEYHRVYEKTKYEWNAYIHNNKFRYERKLFLNILI
jgi:hypothetical protein